VEDNDARIVLDLVLQYLLRIERKVDHVATTQAQLDAFITGTLAPALAAVQTSGQNVQTAINALIAAYQAGTDLTPQLNELQAMASTLVSDQTQAASFVTQIQGETPGAPASTAVKPAPGG
jgi:hypothetical protein